MAGFLSRNYSSKPQSETQESLDRLEPELAPEEGSSEPYYKNVEVRARTEEPAQDIPQSEREPKSANKKEVDSGAIPHPPLDPNAKYNQSRRKAQSEWAKRRREGFVDYGAEMGEDAKIWQAALFSAISTAFMAISVQSLRQDPVDTSAQTLLVISQTLIAMSGGGPPNSSSSGLGQAVAEFRPSFIAIAINGLWFSSLGLSLAVSFITMLAKEWCATLMIDRTFGTYKSQARLRQRRWNEIERLGMANVLGALFLFLHLALALFGAGLCIYLWDLSIYIAIPVTAIALASLLVYISTAVHSITVENSPYTAMSSLHFLLGYHNKEGFILHTGPKVVMKDTWSRDFYVNDKSGMASRIVDDGLDFRIERFSADPDITVFWSNFSFAIASETDPQHPRYFDLFQNEAIEKIEAHINCAIVLHPTTLIATVRQMTNKLCLLTHPGDNHPWTPFRLCFLLLRLYLHSERYDKHEDLQHAISIAVAAAVLNFGEFPGSSHPPGPATSAARAAEFVVQHNPPRSITFGSVARVWLDWASRTTLSASNN
ncbi:hypothetical protein FRC07_001799 [Ceratobasidium sp. 392]|nr:hypothetical protein FRC07_001799 [Ceratobasidium sp. 392]